MIMLTAVVLENVEAASEPPGEGVVVIVDFGDNVGNNVGGGRGQYHVDFLLFCQNPDF